MDSSDSSEPDSSVEWRSRSGSRHRGVLSARNKRAILREKQDGRCWYCGREMTQILHSRAKLKSSDETFDHLVPRCKGGNESESNLVLACYWCNHLKRDKTVEEFRKDCRWSLKKRGGQFYGETMTSSSAVERSPDKGGAAGSIPALSTMLCGSSSNG